MHVKARSFIFSYPPNPKQHMHPTQLLTHAQIPEMQLAKHVASHPLRPMQDLISRPEPQLKRAHPFTLTHLGPTEKNLQLQNYQSYLWIVR